MGDTADAARPTPTAESPEPTPWERECGAHGPTGRHTRLRAHLDVSLGPGRHAPCMTRPGPRYRSEDKADDAFDTRQLAACTGHGTSERRRGDDVFTTTSNYRPTRTDPPSTPRAHTNQEEL